MAGVSLALRRMLGGRSVAAQAGGYAYAGAAMAGPWVLTALAMLALQAAVLPSFSAEERLDFQARVLWSYALSTLLLGTLQLPLARAVSDRLFAGDLAALAPAHAAGAVASLLLHAAASLVFLAVRPAPAATAAAQTAFLGSLGLVWTGMGFLTAARRVGFVTGAFAAGLAASVAAAALLSRVAGTAGLLWGLAWGHAGVAALFAARLRAEFPSERAPDPAILRGARAHPGLLVLGLAQAGALWIDKAVYWAGPWSVRTSGGLRVCPVYDNAMFLACLTVLPALAMLFLRLEISFGGAGLAFFRAIRRGAGLDELRARRNEVRRAFRDGLGGIAAVQAPVTLAILAVAPWLMERAGLDVLQYYVFRTACLGTFLQVLVLACLLAAVHLARYRLAAGLGLLNFLANGALTLAAAAGGEEYAGLGLVGAGVLTLAAGIPLLTRTLRELDRLTFMAPPP